VRDAWADATVAVAADFAALTEEEVERMTAGVMVIALRLGGPLGSS